MSVSTEYVEYIKQLLDGLPDLTVKKYFGGIALRSSWLGKDAQFATIINDVLYFVVDETTRPRYEAKGMKSFSMKNRIKQCL